ncbi:MAG TPA: DUF1464 family protein [Gemmatimonadaceae bacterium]
MNASPRTLGIDPGTVTIDLCGLDDGVVFLDQSLPTADALADIPAFIALLRDARPALIAGPSGYGLPLTPVERATETDLRLAYLAGTDDHGGIGGLRTLARALRDAALPVLFTPGVVHLPSVPAYRKINRVDMGTADKVCAVALGIHEQARTRECGYGEVSFILLELGGAFSAAIAVNEGRIVDGLGGSSGPLGIRAAGALDGEVAFLAGTVTKDMLFTGGVASILGDADHAVDRIAEPRAERDQVARDALVESAVKAVGALAAATRRPYEILLSGRASHAESIVRELRLRLSPIAPTRRLEGFARTAKEAAQGAALIADGLVGGPNEALVNALGLREATGTVLDYLLVISPNAARRRLGIA